MSLEDCRDRLKVVLIMRSGSLQNEIGQTSNSLLFKFLNFTYFEWRMLRNGAGTNAGLPWCSHGSYSAGRESSMATKPNTFPKACGWSLHNSTHFFRNFTLMKAVKYQLSKFLPSQTRYECMLSNDMQTQKYADGRWTEVQASDRFKLTKTDAQVSPPTLNLVHLARSILNLMSVHGVVSAPTVFLNSSI